MGHFDKYFESKHGRKPEISMEYHNLLSFLPSFHLQGQKPSVWWTRLHDIDLLVGTFRHGYAMYDKMKSCEEFGFAELEKSMVLPYLGLYFQDFPNADTITRRLKKLILLIVRHEKEAGSFDFESKESIDNELDEFKTDEKKDLFDFLCDYGIPINPEGKPNWNEVREKFYAYSTKYEAKSALMVEKLIQEFRLICHQIIHRHNFEEFIGVKVESKYKVAKLHDTVGLTAEDAETFYHNTNVLKFIRKTILFNNRQIFKSYLDELLEESAGLTPDHPAYIPDYNPEIQDL